MSKIDALRKAKTKPDLARLLDVRPSFLTHTIYILRPETQYNSFEISKKNGGVRTILAPSKRLKSLQAALSELLQDCMEEIEQEEKIKSKNFSNNMSHGFVREKSIITNANLHLKKKNILNVDLEDFFGSFNFGRVRGFFIKNRNFNIDPEVATVIAQIACYENKLPQGSPCSPVITNLITHALDIRLAKLAKRYSCFYSRYADDITISTREKNFPPQIMGQEENEYIISRIFEKEIERAGFKINQSKTRILYRDSRQEVTGLVVNKKPGIKYEYWRVARAQCAALFKSGSFTQEVDGEKVNGNLLELEGRLSFIDQIDRFNRIRVKEKLNPHYQPKKHGNKKNELLNGRERTFSRFLYYRWFYGNDKPTILCEGQTDNIYLKSAIGNLSDSYPSLIARDGVKHTLLVKFFKYSKRTRFLLNLYGGTSYIDLFLDDFKKNHAFFKGHKPKNPVIIVMDNDSGFNNARNKLVKMKAAAYPQTVTIENCRDADFIHVSHNIYIVLTPTTKSKKETAVEDLFYKKVLSEKVNGKTFNPASKINNEKEYGKEIFAKKMILANKKNINFTKFKKLLNRMVMCIEHYESLKNS